MSRFKFLKSKLDNDEKEKKITDSSFSTLHSNQRITKPPSDYPKESEKKAGKPKKFEFLKDKQTPPHHSSSGNGQRVHTAQVPAPNSGAQQPSIPLPHEKGETKKPSILPGSDGEHRLQEKFGTAERAHTFYERQVLDFLSPAMQDFIVKQEFLFVASADRNGECDCTSKFGKPGFIRVLSSKYLMYPEYRGNGVYANSGNISENPHIAMLIIDFFKDTVGIHVNGKARLVENHELSDFADDLPENVIDEINQEGKKCPERWVMVEVEEAYMKRKKPPFSVPNTFRY